jgi:hypothetical protein
MSFYPSIDYVGAGKAIADQWSDLPRVDREREATAQREQLQNRQMTLYDLQAKKEQMQLEAMQQEQDFNKTLAGAFASEKAAGSFDPTIGQTTIPDYTQALGGDEYSVPGEKTSFSVNPAKYNIPDYLAQAQLAAGRFPQYLQAQKEALAAKKEDEADFRSKLKSVTDVAEKGFPTLATGIARSYAEKDSRFKMVGEFNFNEDGSMKHIINDPNGQPYGWRERGPGGAWTPVIPFVKTKTPYELAVGDLTAQLGRTPTDTETRKSMADEAIKLTGAKAEATERGKQVGGFLDWTPQAKQQAFVYNLVTKEPPVSTKGMASGDRKVYAKEYTQWQVDSGFKPGDIVLMQADLKAGTGSLANMEKQEAPMAAFVGNINKQIDKIQQLYSNDDRTGLRLLDKTIRDLRVAAKGSGEEAVKASYLLEISNEIGKLSSGASGSVQQLSDSAKEDWKKVHDVNLSLGEIMKVVNATRDQANMRLSTWRDAKETVRGMIGTLGDRNSGPAAGGENNPGNIMKPGGEQSGRRNYGTPEEGFIAIPHLLLTDRNYKGKTVDEALKTYSNNGYSGDIVPDLKNKQVSNLTAQEMAKLTQTIIKYEGNTKAQGVNIPKVGEVIKGYRFKGGMPSNKESWEKVS